jgi:DNA-binding FadR family transcriptional regulator
MPHIVSSAELPRLRGPRRPRARYRAKRDLRELHRQEFDRLHAAVKARDPDNASRAYNAALDELARRHPQEFDLLYGEELDSPDLDCRA